MEFHWASFTRRAINLIKISTNCETWMVSKTKWIPHTHTKNQIVNRWLQLKCCAHQHFHYKSEVNLWVKRIKKKNKRKCSSCLELKHINSHNLFNPGSTSDFAWMRMMWVCAQNRLISEQDGWYYNFSCSLNEKKTNLKCWRM